MEGAEAKQGAAMLNCRGEPSKKGGYLSRLSRVWGKSLQIPAALVQPVLLTAGQRHRQKGAWGAESKPFILLLGKDLRVRGHLCRHEAVAELGLDPGSCPLSIHRKVHVQADRHAACRFLSPPCRVKTSYKQGPFYLSITSMSHYGKEQPKPKSNPIQPQRA